ncbi:MAG: DUF4145 domain-containing protein [Chloroflexi bacterium]|nr:DUF4145 domain-containing protein [Chloroflexota bacterium]
MPLLANIFELDRCPHCRVDHPNLQVQATFKTTAHRGNNSRIWKTYMCGRCGGVVLASARQDGEWAQEIYPNSTIVDEAIPEPARTYLNQAIDSLHSPAGSVMLSASSVDAMLKAKNYKDGSLYTRINKAVEIHLITQEMSQWAHEVRLDANDQRHADEKVTLPTANDAQRCIDFVLAFGEFLFVLPSRVKSGLANVDKEEIKGVSKQ